MSEENQNADDIFSFSLGFRDENAPEHWREAPKDYSFLGHKTILILPGSATNSAQDANGMCKIVRKLLSKDLVDKVDICSLYYPKKTKYRQASVYRGLKLLDEYILPLVSKKNKDGGLEKISADRAAKNLRNLVVFTHCYGSYMLEAIDIKLAKDLQNLGYTPKEQERIQRQMFVVQHNSISDMVGQLNLNSTNLYRFTQADERRKNNMFSCDCFQYYVQKAIIEEDKPLYAKVGKNERALIVKQITEDGEYEHNGAYWNNDKKSEGGEKEQQVFSIIFNEAVSSDYSLDNIEKLIRNAAKDKPEVKAYFTPILSEGKIFSDDFRTYHNDIVDRFEMLRYKQVLDELKEKEVKRLPAEVLLYRDEEGKMLLDYAIEKNNVVQAKILWNAVRKMLPKKEGLYELEFQKLSQNHSQAYENNKAYLQLMLDAGRPEMFAILAKGADDLPRLNYENANDATLLGAAKVYAGLPANTGQLDRLYYYHSLIYMYSRIEKMPQTEEVAEVIKQLDGKMFTKSNAKDKAVMYKIRSYASQFGIKSLLKKCEQQWDKKSPAANSNELNQQPQSERSH